MADLREPGASPPRPDVVDIVPVSAVAPLMARHEEELRGLRRQLEEARSEAEAAEGRLRAHPAAAAVFDDDFEARVLSHLHWSISHLDSAATGPAAGRTVGRVRSVLPAEESDRSPLTTEGDRLVFPTPTVEPPRPAQDAARRPRTVVVDRGQPRTVVVERGGQGVAPPPVPFVAPPPAPSPPPPAPPADTAVQTVFAASPEAEQFITSEANRTSVLESNEVDDGRRRRTRRTKGGSAAKIPSRLLIQVGVVVVVVALLLLKIG